MNILLIDGLPEDYDGIPLSTDFRNMINVDLIMSDTESSEAEKTIATLNQLYPEIPTDLEKAMEGLVWFYTRGKVSAEDEKDQPVKGSTPKAFDFEQDANLIYAAFYATYNISLATVEYLHWWEFMALFEGLPEDTLVQRVLYWRTADLAGMPKNEKTHLLKMRKLFALKETGKKAMTVEELNQQTKDRVAERFAKAKAAKEKADKKTAPIGAV